jgi:hypothetical protein
MSANEEKPGGSTPSQYGIPEGATDLQDLIEYREMNFALGNIFKACYRRGACSHSDELRDARKILWFAQREVDRLEAIEAGHKDHLRAQAVQRVKERIVAEAQQANDYPRWCLNEEQLEEAHRMIDQYDNEENKQ